MLTFLPMKDRPSGILTDVQISKIVEYLPSFHRMSDWKRLYRLDVDGRSMLTFFAKCREYDTTVLVVQDQNKYVFGAFCTEKWACTHQFFGQGDNFLYTFKDTDDLTVYNWTGDGENRHQYSDGESIGLGGGLKGRFSLYLMNNFESGTSYNTEVYENEVLASATDFRIL